MRFLTRAFQNVFDVRLWRSQRSRTVVGDTDRWNDHAETKMAEMEESGLIFIAEIILQNGTLSCLDIVLFFFV